MSNEKRYMAYAKVINKKEDKRQKPMTSNSVLGKLSKYKCKGEK